MVYVKLGHIGRRNLTDFHRNRIALRYEEILKKKAKERQSEYYGNQFQEVDFGSNDPKSKEPFETNTELGKIAGTSRASVMRTKVILKHGTQENKEIDRCQTSGYGGGLLFIQTIKRNKE